jgi:two-component system, OmpR family, response regulator
MPYHRDLAHSSAAQGIALSSTGKAAETPPRILVIEDDRAMSAAITECLTRQGYSVQASLDGTEGLGLALSGHFDLITLDRMLPGHNGLQIAEALRGAGLTTPILMLSALSELDERLAGLRAGGDDYVIKPFEPSELAVRVAVLLRRKAMTQGPPLLLRAGNLELDLVAREARREGRAIELLPTEFKLLEFLMRNPGQMLSRRMIFEHVWGYHFDPGTNLIDVHVGKLRKKIDPPEGPSLIRTERGSGYILDAL